MKLTFAQLKGKLLSSVSTGVKMSPVQKCAHIMYKHFVTGHRQFCACTFPFDHLEKKVRREFIKEHQKAIS